MENKKQVTAVEWLEQILYNKEDFNLSEIIEQAKELEKQLIMLSYSDGLGNGIAVGDGHCSFKSVYDEEQYYNKKFKNK
jgi:hypothetical protein